MILKLIFTTVVVFICFGLMAYSCSCERMLRMKKKELLKDLQRIKKALDVTVDKVTNGVDEYDDAVVSVFINCIYKDLRKIYDIADDSSSRERFYDLVKK